MKSELTQEQLKELLHYDPETGAFTWRGVRKGPLPKDGLVGCISKPKGYRMISIQYTSYKAHRLAWFYMTGAWPKEHIDHINGVPDDNRFANLREATNRQNSLNRGKRRDSSAPLKGITWNKSAKQWYAQGQVNGKKVHIGSFDCPAAAHLAYVVWADIHHGEFARVA